MVDNLICLRKGDLFIPDKWVQVADAEPQLTRETNALFASFGLEIRSYGGHTEKDFIDSEGNVCRPTCADANRANKVSYFERTRIPVKEDIVAKDKASYLKFRESHIRVENDDGTAAWFKPGGV